MASPLISLTVCVRNGAHWVDDCMTALCAQTYRPLEIIAVDDGSTDGSNKMLQKWQTSGDDSSEEIPIQILSQEPLGLSAGRNEALNIAKGEWVAITDIDCRPRPDWLERMFASSDGMDAVTGRVIFDEGRTSVSRLRSRTIAWKYSSRSDKATLANGPCSMFRREHLISRGGFDPSWYHAEDMEVSMKIIQSGGGIRYEPEAVVDHVAESRLKIFFQKRRRDARAHTRIMRKYRGAKHDFSKDGMLIAFLLIPYAALSFTIANFLDPVITTAVILVSTIIFRNYLLWSAALWLGTFEGCVDALLRRNGH